ncbi:GNAT family N-acetyltransferase [Abyssibius alkaniclasticus]|uniref:GNAT family N-acetyltransferase n=1 Tax=Abyssibius alkaniclasticus TaxID=2881234 RepID=UPI004058AA09
MTPRRVAAPYDWAALHRLIADSFAYMDGRIDPPSSIASLTPAAIAAHAAVHDVWVIEAGGTPVACLLGQVKGDRYYLGKIAADAAHRNLGLARRLMEASATNATGCAALQLQTRVELVENQRAFARLGFVIVAESSHSGYARPTSVTMERPI